MTEQASWSPLEVIEDMRKSSRDPVTFRDTSAGEIVIRPKFDRNGVVEREELTLMRMQLVGAAQGFMRLHFIEWWMKVYTPSAIYDFI